MALRDDPPLLSAARRPAPALARRRLLGLLPALAAAGAQAQPQVRAPSQPPSGSAHDPFGPVRPALPVPDLRLVGEDGRPFGLAARLQGRVSAVQLMFTGCSATCPIQGALFAAVAPQLKAAEAQLLSISIDALGDTPAALARWLERLGRHPAWHAAVPRVEDVERLLDFLRARGRGADRHTAQVYLFDRQARLAYRTAEWPPAGFVAQLLGQMAAM